MKVIILMLIGSLLLGGFFLVAYIWSVKSGQMEDEYSAANKILFEDNKEINKK